LAFADGRIGPITLAPATTTAPSPPALALSIARCELVGLICLRAGSTTFLHFAGVIIEVIVHIAVCAAVDQVVRDIFGRIFRRLARSAGGLTPVIARGRAARIRFRCAVGL
jgi:hypothetical protein